MPDSGCKRDTLEYPLQPPSPDATVVAVAPGLLWARMPMPMKLDHINVYLLRDDDGWYLVDTGLNIDAGKALWRRIIAQHLDGLPVKGLICTHFHYDHAGLADWISEHFNVPLYMTHGEFHSMRLLSEPLPEPAPESVYRFYRRAGLADEITAQILARLRRDPFLAPPPAAFRRLRDGQQMRIGGRDWQVVIGEGHSPEHACLYCREDRLLIAGDQLLPRITSNVLVSSIEPDADPLRLWLASLDRLDQLDAETTVLPSHERVFRGLHLRVRQLRDHHSGQFDILRQLVARQGSCSAVQAMRALFPRELGAMDQMMALGESIAHLSWLCGRGEFRRVLGEGGVYRFSSTTPA